jgi:hypothetical protein
MIRGTSTQFSANWMTTATPATISAFSHDWVSAIATAGTPPIHGPMIGIASVIPAINPNTGQNRTSSRP